MAIAYSCMLIVILLPYIWVYFGKFGKAPDGSKRRYNNYTPRLQQAKLEGFPARAVWAQNNSFESHPAFLAAVLVAIQTGVTADQVNIAAVIYTITRVLHGVFYMANWASLRSTAWAAGLLAVVYLFIQAILKVA
ncbi:MAPEG family protein [Chitinimonas naiadis]